MRIILSIVLFLNISFACGQSCFPGGLFLTTQEQVDAFPSENPDCTFIEGTIRVNANNDIINLDSLKQITKAGGLLLIDATALISLSGLSSIDSILSPVSINNTAIASLEGLQNIKYINSISINENDLLEDVSALSNLPSCSNRLSFSRNAILKEVIGFNQLKNASQISFFENPQLEAVITMSKF